MSILFSSGMSFWKAITDSAFDLCASLCPRDAIPKCRNVIEMVLVFQIEAFSSKETVICAFISQSCQWSISS